MNSYAKECIAQYCIHLGYQERKRERKRKQRKKERKKTVGVESSGYQTGGFGGEGGFIALNVVLVMVVVE